MKPRTHDRIAGIAAAQADFSPLERHLFCLGAAIPDYLPTQFLHRHFYQKSADYVFRKLQKYSGRTSLFALFRLGELTHYMSDFCCSVHRSGGIGNPRLHLSYERQMQRYFMGKSGLVYCREPDDADSADCHRSAANVLPAAVHGFSHRLVGGDSGESCCLQKVCAFGAAETGIFGRCSKW